MDQISNINHRIEVIELTEDNLNMNPFVQLRTWLKEAEDCELLDYNAMALATVGKDLQPSSRMVLLKEILSDGVVFFTNYRSKKAMQLAIQPKVSAVIYWPQFERQIRIEGLVERLDEASSDEYYDSRPYGSKIGAWASPQSQPIPNRNYLENLKSDYEEIMKDKIVKRPDFWGGYILKPVLIEFWKGREDRLHDRFEYRKDEKNWNVQRLAP
jgi:pyridoxamine 5'-phosphate oxidase